MHAALAEATDPTLDPDRQAWHRAEAVEGPDERVAAELERSADRARTRGGAAAAAAFLERSVELTVDPVLRSRRALAAAHAMRAAAATESALELIATAELGPLDALQRAQAERLRAQVLVLRTDHERGGARAHQGRGDARAARPGGCLGDLRRGSGDGPPSWWRPQDRGDRAGARRASALGAADSAPADPPRLRDPVLQRVSARHRRLVEAVARYVAAAPGQGDTVTEIGGIAARTARILWDAAASRTLSARALAIARSSGAVALLEEALYAYGTICMDQGRIAEATAALAEENALKHAAGLPLGPPGRRDAGGPCVTTRRPRSVTSPTFGSRFLPMAPVPS